MFVVPPAVVLQLDEQLATGSISNLDGPIAISKCSMRSRKFIDSAVFVGGSTEKEMFICVYSELLPDFSLGKRFY